MSGIKNNSLVRLLRERALFAPLSLIASTTIALGTPGIASANGFTLNVPSGSIQNKLDCSNEKDEAYNFCDKYFGTLSTTGHNNVPDEDTCNAHGAATEGQIRGAFHDYSNGNCAAIVSSSDMERAGVSRVTETAHASTTADASTPTSDPAARIAFNPATPRQASAACKEATRITTACKIQTSQLKPHCMAIIAVGPNDGENENVGNTKTGGIVIDTLLVGLDLAAATTCTIECASPPINAGAGCRILGIAAAGSEFAASLAMQQSGAAAHYAGLIGGSIGVAGSIGTLAASKTVADESLRASSCIMAAWYGILGGIRIGNIATMESVKEKECNALNDLISKMEAFKDPAKENGSGSGNNGGNTPGPGQAGNIGAGDGSRSGEGNRNSLVGRQNTNDTATPRTAETRTAETVNATSDDSKIVHPMKGQIPLDKAKEIAAQARKQGIGATLGGMLGGAGEIGAALAGLAQDAKDHPENYKDLAQKAGYSGSSYSSSGGAAGGGSSKSGGGDNPFANLFGAGGAKEGGARAPSSEQFGKTAEDDIWHSKSTMNLFEIVSNKVSKVTTRVGVK